ncbi:hypothetical protein N9X55_04980, partial [Flavobacteriaceae bacterium]|nr:hypothetical protein [Flavobacteriaceae bacterium]
IIKIIIAMLFIHNIYGQDDTFIRSSLHMVMIEDFNFNNGPLVKNSFEKYPFPEGVYNNHNVNQKYLDLTQYILTPEEEVQYGVNKSGGEKLLSDVATASSAGIIQDNSKVEYQLLKFINQNKFSHELLKKWFNIKEDGSFNQDYVAEMIDLQLTVEQKKAYSLAASESAETDKNREYLIDNTYIVFTRMNFVSNEVVALPIYEKAKSKANELSGIKQTLALKAAESVYNKTKEGYSVWTTGWLFDLKWDKLDVSNFKKAIVSGKIDFEKFYETNFSLNYIGTEKATSLVTFSLKKGEANRSESEIIELSTNRNIDKVLVKLQRGYEQFMPVFPIQSEKPIGAYLGMKEGLEGGEVFEFLAKQTDGTFKSKGSIKVDKKKIWDNRYGSSEKKGMTYFKGKLPKNVVKGDIIRQKR